MKIIINKCYGGFEISHKAMMRYAELKGITLYAYVDAPFPKKEILPYDGKSDTFLIYYTTQPIDNEDDLSKYFFTITGRENRNDPILIQVVEELGEHASGNMAKLKVVEIPDDVSWIIQNHAGIEWIAEAHRTWD